VRRGLREQALDRLPLSPANSACRKEQGSSPRAGARIDLALIGSLRTGAASACPFDLGVAIEDDVTPGNATDNEDGVADVEAFAWTAFPFSSVALLAADGV